MRAQRLAADVLAADPLAWLHDFDRTRLWPPLHAVLASIPLAVSGLDFRTAILPSAVGFVLACGFAFLCGRRASGGRGAAAEASGLVALVFVATSPVHRRYAGDVMLESLGAGLTLASVFFFLGTVHGVPERRPAAARWLGLCLTLLLVEKYNYYLVAVAGLGLAGLQSAGRDGVAALAALARRARPRVESELRHPLVWLGLALWAGAAAVAITGGGSFEVLERRVSIRNPFNLVHFGYLALFARAGLAVRGHFRATLADLPSPWRELALWHAVPLAIWFALPRRLGYFLHHVSPGNTPPGAESLGDRLAFYAHALAHDYHGLGGVGAAATAVLAGVAVVGWRRLRPEARACLVFAAVAALATALHPNAQSRFAMTWMPVVWVVAATSTARLARGVPAASAVAIVALGYGVFSWTHADPPARRPSVLAMTDAYRPNLEDGPVAVVTDHPAEELVEWRYVATGGTRERLEIYTPRRRDTRAAREAHFREWLSERAADRLLFLEVTPASPWHVPGYAIYEELGAFVRGQTLFVPEAEPRPAGPGVTWQMLARSESGRP